MKILLHICCGVCAGAVAEELMCEGHVITGYFYNPCIHPQDEYKRRLEAARRVSEEMHFELIEEIYDRENWFEKVKGAEYSEEGGERCALCFDMRLRKTFEFFRKKQKYKKFTTTLSVSPHKNADLINETGREIGGESFLLADFKRKGGFQRAMEFAKDMDLYRQDYCGCIYSQEEMSRKRRAKSKGRVIKNGDGLIG